MLDEAGNIVGTYCISRNQTKRKRAEAALQLQSERLQRIVETQRDLAATDLDLESVMTLACERLQDLSGAEGASILMIEGDELFFRASTGFSSRNIGMRLPQDGTVASWVHRHNRSVIIEDTHTDARAGELSRKHGIRSHVIVPLHQGGDPIGSIHVVSPRVGAFDDDTVRTLELISVALFAALSHAGELQAKRAEVAALDQFRTIFEAAPIGIVRTDAVGRTVTANPALERMLGFSASELAELGFTEHSCEGHVTENNSILGESPERRFDPTLSESYRAERLFGRKDGTAVWTQVTARLASDPDGSASYGLAMIEDISRRKEAEEAFRNEAERNEFQALHDPLTGLANRVLFRDRIQLAISGAQRTNASVAVLMMDIDRFKEINDSLGHHAGDLLLVELATRLEARVRGSDTVARLGGDEFGIVLPEDCSPAEIQVVIERILGALEEPFELDEVAVAVELSIGVARFPRDGDDVMALLRHADVAMYTAKRASTSHAFYDADQDVHDPAQLSLLGELRRAIEKRELELYFQPKALLETGDVRSVEALIRWNHPTRGLVLPDEFIPMAQQTSLIMPLTLFVVDEALRHVRLWQEQGLELAVAVNLSVRNLWDVTFPDEVQQLLEKSGVDPALLEMEITESTMLADPERVQEVLTRLSGLGIRLSIDDFGIGYSSLSYLRRLPVDEIKIDRSFVSNMDGDASDAAIVRSVIELAKSLGLDVVAEGVETRETWERLASFGCAFAQGYFLCRPLPGDEFLQWIVERGAGPSAA